MADSHGNTEEYLTRIGTDDTDLETRKWGRLDCVACSMGVFASGDYGGI